MAICREYGAPDLFVTFTCNPKWDEIALALSLEPGQTHSDRVDICARVFKMKLDELYGDIRGGFAFGPTRAAGFIDSIVSAELPDIKVDPLAYPLVDEFMGSDRTKIKVQGLCPHEASASGLGGVDEVEEYVNCLAREWETMYDQLNSEQLAIYDSIDLLSEIQPSNASLPFGGFSVVLGGDFWQVLPVIPGASKQEVLDAALCSSPLWLDITVFSLRTNMRLQAVGLSDKERD
ncbi:uncharacterized protein LOC100826557 [Brachypodium distachyon]|uniref:uncharacterized protein LOC100826557 n=1 Tax=Brachypodium distachyon TaxID=15368 RepID=UPI00052FF9EE|nr:uncharacterized protein LOC100826557 [Brachypodium distachyon]|eukprot:XP_010236537.1 uncharacterized protein LOC100826557 [Brachypodium distachyon]